MNHEEEVIAGFDVQSFQWVDLGGELHTRKGQHLAACEHAALDGGKHDKL